MKLCDSGNVGWEEGWAEVKARLDEKIEPALKKEGWMNHRKTLFSAKDVANIYSVVYNLCTQRSPLNWSRKLYDQYKETMNEYLSVHILSKLRTYLPKDTVASSVAAHVFFAEQLRSAQSDASRISRYLCKFFRYLDKYYVVHTSSVPLKLVSMQCFVDTIIEPLQQEITMAMLQLVHRVFETSSREMKTLASQVAEMLSKLARSRSADEHELNAWKNFMDTIQKANLEAHSPLVVGGVTLRSELCEEIEQKLLPHLTSLEIFRCSMEDNGENKNCLAGLVSCLGNDKQNLKRLTISRTALDDSMLLEITKALESSKKASGSDALRELYFPKNALRGDSYTTMLRLGGSFDLDWLDLSENYHMLEGIGLEENLTNRSLSIRRFEDALSNGSLSVRSIDLSSCGLGRDCVSSLTTAVLELQHRNLDLLKLGNVNVEMARDDPGELWRVVIGEKPAVRGEPTALGESRRPSYNYNGLLNAILASPGVVNISKFRLIGWEPLAEFAQDFLSNATSLVTFAFDRLKVSSDLVPPLAAGLTARSEDGGLEELILSGCSISDNDLVRLVESISALGGSLRKLDLTNNSFVQGYQPLANILRSCPLLEALHASGTASGYRANGRNMSHTTLEQILPFLDACQESENLREISFPHTICLNSVMREVCSALANTNTLRFLDLQWVEKPIDVDVLFSPTSSQLSLSYLGVYETDTRVLGDALQTNTSLVKCEIYCVGRRNLLHPEISKILERNRLILAAQRCAESPVPVSRLCSVMEKLAGVQGELTPLYVCLRGKHI